MSATLTLVRHGRAAAGFAAERDPGLDATGRAEAEAVAAVLGRGPVQPVLVSPLRRCRETAAPLERRWGRAAQVEPAVAEVVAPTDDLAGRAEWLRGALAARWADLDPAPRAWRQQLLARLAAIDVDTVVVTHFVVVNAVIGAATGDDAVLIARVGNGSCTTVEVDAGSFGLVSVGERAESEVR